MQLPGFSPYQMKRPRREFHLPEFSGGAKKWLAIVIVILVGLWVIAYIALGDLRFFMAHYLRFTFFSKNYLVLLQNNYEARPAGGFITAYGNLDTFMGFPTELSFHNSYDIDVVSDSPAPSPQEKFLKNEWYAGYTFRDSNWEPNFPDATQDLIAFYQKKFPEADVDGIVVINFSMIENMVDKLGGIKLGNQWLTKENLFSVLEHEVSNIDRHSEEALSSRKNILSDLASALVSKAKWHPFATKAVIIRAFKEKDMYLWLASGLQENVAEKGWGNALSLPEKSDFISLNVANLGAKKADRYIEREVHHFVNISKEIPEMTTEVILRFPGFTNNYADNYKGYARLIIPGAATLQNKPEGSVEEQKDSLKMIGTEIVLPAGSKTTLVYTYTLPRHYFENNKYALRLAKQSGQETHMAVVVETPPETIVKSDDFEPRENRAFFRAVPDGDRDLALSITADPFPPYPLEQVFEDLKTIRIYWNEPIDTSTGNDATNYMITDLNITNETFDDVKTVYAEVVDGSVSKLELSGVSNQPMERYRVEMKNIRDPGGNATDPDPMVITVVQRLTEAANPPEP
ncbi:DUF4012 domain-containing protein [Candidatus Peregrinibacteria bacterium]|nr:DUF4012 domain-containing protein [Candidatus Peregrinibacteria bacterium]